MAQQVLRQLAASLQSAMFYALMVDETTDKANREQDVLVFRWVDDALTAHKTFVGLYLTDSITSKALVALIKDVLLRMNLKIKHCRGQCYDGASSMTGAKSGVAKILRDEEPRAIFTHCYGHALNLAVGDCVKQCNVMKAALDIVAEISKLIKSRQKEMQPLKNSRLTLLLKQQGFGFSVPRAELCMLHLYRVSLITIRFFCRRGEKL